VVKTDPVWVLNGKKEDGRQIIQKLASFGYSHSTTGTQFVRKPNSSGIRMFGIWIPTVLGILTTYPVPSGWGDGVKVEGL
jgi:hypothetical protein